MMKKLMMWIGLLGGMLVSTGTGSVINSSNPVWYVTQPIKAKAFSDALFPEAGVDLAAKNDNGQLLWSRHKEWADGSQIGLPSPDSAATYLYRVISSKNARNVTVGLSSDDGIEVWLNGKEDSLEHHGWHDTGSRQGRAQSSGRREQVARQDFQCLRRLWVSIQVHRRGGHAKGHEHRRAADGD